MIAAPVIELPKLRDDLIVKRQETVEGTFFVIKDPRTGRFFRFRDVEHFICRQLDGATPVSEIRQRIEEKFGSSPAPEALEQFVRSLGRIGLLDTGKKQGEDSASAKRRVRGSLLYLRFKAFDPDRLLDHLASKVGFFFTPYFVALSVFVIVWALATTVTNWDDISRDVGTLWHFDVLLLAWITVLSVTTLHEFAHGLTCKHFGGEVREMGFMLIYFQPAFYCNVSDAWLFPEKSKRLWVTFAGAYFEVFLWALATLAWRAAELGTWISSVALVVMATSGIKSLFNLNPLIKLDGYYLLSDYLEIPNLRQKSAGYLRGLLRRVWGSTVEPAEVTPRARRIYILYGLVAGIYSFWLLSYFALSFGKYLVARYQGVGLILFGGFIMVLFRNTLRKIFSWAAAPFSAKQMGFGSRKAGILLALAVFLVLLFLGRMELKVSGEFTIFPVWNADIRAVVEGIIREIYVDQGNRVDQGQPIVTLSDRDYSNELKKVMAELHEKEANLMKLKAGSRMEEIEVVRKEEERAQARLKFAEKNFERFKELLRRDLISRMQFEEAEEQVAVRQKELEETQARLRLLLAGSRREEIDAAQAEMARLEVQQRYLGEQIGLVRVVSPVSGVVTTHNLKEKVGQHVKKGDLIAEVHELKTVKAEMVIPEKEIADVRVGQDVVLKVRAYPNLSFEGKVAAIAPIATKAEEKWQQRTVLVTTELRNDLMLLKPEMTGNAKIYCGKRRIFDLITRRLARYIRVEFWSWW